MSTLGDLTLPKVDQSGPPKTGEFTYIDISSIDNKLKRIVEPKRLPVSAAPSRAKQRLQPGDVLVSMTRPNLNAVALVTPDLKGAIGSTGFHVLRPTDGIESRWLFYVVQTHAFVDAMSSVVQGALYPAVRPKDIRAFGIDAPSWTQQQRIVAEIEKQFSRLNEAVASLKRVEVDLKRYKAAVLKTAVEGKLTEDWRKQHPNVEPASKLLERILAKRQARCVGKGELKIRDKPDLNDLSTLPVGWEWSLTDALFSFVTSGSRGWARYYSQEGPLFLRVGNLDHDSIRLDLTDIQRVKPPKGTEGTRTKVETGDILISITADVGMIAVAPQGIEEAYINQHIALTRPVPEICREYLAWYLATPDGGQKQFRRLQRGATKPGLGLDDIRAVPVPVPPLAEQQQIVAEVERRFSVIDELESTVEANLIRADRQRQSILQQAFSGQLVPAESNAKRVLVIDEFRKSVNIEVEPIETLKDDRSKIQEVTSTMANLIDALSSASDWISAQEAFRLCGVGPGAETKAIERMYLELRGHIESGKIVVNRRDESDWLRLSDHRGA